MRRASLSWLAGILVAAGVLVGSALPVRAAESPLAGNWKIVVLSGGYDINVWLVGIKDKGGKTTAELLSVGFAQFEDSKLEKFKADARALHFTFKAAGNNFEVTVQAPRGKKASKQLLGSFSVDGQFEFVRLERTELEKLDPKKRPVQTEVGKELEKAARIKDKDERDKALKGFLEKYPKDPAGHQLAMYLLNMAVGKDPKEADIRAQAEAILVRVAPFGPEMQLGTATQVAQQLLRSKKLASLAVVYARKAEKLLPESAPAGQRAAVLKALVTALRKAGKGDEAKDVDTQLAKLDKVLDEEFVKTAIPFKPDSYDGRKAKSDRVVVVELFTGAQCPPCVAADVAFDASLKTYKPRDVVLLQYHLHIPGPDPLTNKDSEVRAKYYGRQIEGAPTVFINGKPTAALGGYKQHAKGSYEKLRKAVDEQLEEMSQGQLQLTADRKGDKIELTANISGLKKTGDDVRLRFVIVEDVVRYAGRNGQRLHHHVVRALPGGVEGIALPKKSDKQTVTVDLKEVTKALNDYLTDYAKKRAFLDEDRPLDLKHLKAVAFIQDNDSKEILQAAQVDLSEEK